MALNFKQLAFRFRLDDGTEALATWLAPVNTAIRWVLDTNVRLRFETEESGNGDADTGFTLQVSRNGGAYGDTGATAAAIVSASSHFADNDECVQRIATSLLTFDTDNDGMQESNGLSVDKGPYNLLSWEHEWNIQARSAVCSVGDTLDFRERYNAGALQEYTNFPRITIAAKSLQSQLVHGVGPQ